MYSGFMQPCNSSHTMGSRCLGYGLVLYTPIIPYPFLKFVTPSAAKISSFETIRAGMEKTVKGDEYLEFSDETLERRQNIRELFSMGVSC